MRNYIIIGAIGCIGFSSCKVTKPVETTAAAPGPASVARVVDTANAKFVLNIQLNMIEKDGASHFNVIRVVKKEGAVREGARANPDIEQLLAVFTDENGSEVDRVNFRHPGKEPQPPAGEAARPAKQKDAQMTTIVRVNYNARLYYMDIQDKSGKSLGKIDIKKHL
ncbi:MAG TPA: hypothetical protein VEB40_12865 [Flavipsychrobacter sp.]|nr:hypothetical protein [Flavipsychrobacter sp.]